MSVGREVKGFGAGISTFGRGARWLFSHKKYLILAFFPMALGLLFLGLMWGYFLGNSDEILNFILFAEPESWWGLGFYYVAKFILYITLFLLSLIISVLFSNIISSPIYDIISIAVESELLGKKAEEISILESLKLMGEEFKKIFFILFISLLLLFVPGVNMIAIAVTAFLVGWDFFDYPLARRGWSFKERLSFVMSNVSSVTGFGLWLCIPFVQFILMPLAVPGGTMLAIEALEEQSSRKDLIDAT